MRPRDWTRVVPMKVAIPPARGSVTSRIGECGVAVGVALVHRVEHPLGLLAESERGPDVGDRRRVDRGLGEARPLAQTGEELDGDRHAVSVRFARGPA